MMAQAAPSDDGFSLQISPSPLIATVKPGTTTSLDLQIRNTGSAAQTLKMGLRAFKIDQTTGQVDLETQTATDVPQFVTFGTPTFSLETGQIMTQHVTIATPANAGFTYSFAITVAQQTPPQASNGQTAIDGSVAVFTLLNVDRPGATSQLELTQLIASKHVYEYLPATITLKFKNSGNTLIQPKGTVYIQRHSNDAQPLAAINLNQSGGYILPDSSRDLTVTWNDGLPHYDAIDGSTKQKLNWQGGDLTKLRFGRYVAKVVAVYSDGQRDIPITAEVSFWVIPWRLLLVGGVILLLIIVGIVASLLKSTKLFRRRHNRTTSNYGRPKN